MYSYKKLNKILKDKGINKTTLSKDLSISSRTIAKIGKNEKLSSGTLKKIAEYLECSPDNLYDIICDNPILQCLREEKDAKISGGLYHELQIRMTYNSNHIEGSTLSEDQTRMIFETSQISGSDGISTDDILETIHHFRAIDYVIDHAEEPLSEDIIKKLHYILKHDTKDSTLSWFAVGDYKKRNNMVGGHITTPPKEVHNAISKLLNNYNKLAIVTIEDIIKFHSDFEHIHPFQDGNGRVGRLIAFKECLRHNIVPFIIEDTKKLYYYRGLSEWKNEPGYLIDTCLDGQDTFQRLLNALDITPNNNK